MILLGASGYHFKDWSGAFYPPELDKAHWLEYYAQHYSCVEINSTYYGVPKRETVARWARQTPDGFGFFVKLHGDTTHKRETGGEEIAELLAVLQPLRDSGKLLGLLGQFPASFHHSREAQDYLRLVIGHTEGIKIFIEFRHGSWDTDATVEFCRDIGAGWVAVDLPRIAGLPRPRPAVTTDTAYVRFHGRNSATWYDPGRGDRYDWLYSDRELREWRPRLDAMDHRAEKTYLFFNNCHAGQAIKSAEKMRLMLRDHYEVF